MGVVAVPGTYHAYARMSGPVSGFLHACGVSKKLTPDGARAHAQPPGARSTVSRLDGISTFMSRLAGSSQRWTTPLGPPVTVTCRSVAASRFTVVVPDPWSSTTRDSRRSARGTIAVTVTGSGPARQAT